MLASLLGLSGAFVTFLVGLVALPYIKNYKVTRPLFFFLLLLLPSSFFLLPLPLIFTQPS